MAPPAQSGYYGDSRGVTQVLLPPSSQTQKDDGTALTAPNSSQWVAAPAFPSANSPLPSLPPPGIRFTNLGSGFPAPGRVQGRWAEIGVESRSVLLGGQMEAGILGFSGQTPVIHHQKRSQPTFKLFGKSS